MKCKICKKELCSRNKTSLCQKCFARTMQSGEKNHGWKGGISLERCVDCGGKKDVYAKRCMPCDSKLRSKRQAGDRNPMWNGGKSICVTCKKTLSGYDQTYCKKCFGLSIRGENSYNWRGGHSLVYAKDFKIGLKRLIRNRDHHECQECGVHENDCNVKLHVHHIDYNKLNSEIDNLISLCHKCHAKTIAHPEKWINHFKAKVKNYQLN